MSKSPWWDIANVFTEALSNNRGWVMCKDQGEFTLVRFYREEGIIANFLFYDDHIRYQVVPGMHYRIELADPHGFDKMINYIRRRGIRVSDKALGINHGNR